MPGLGCLNFGHNCNNWSRAFLPIENKSVGGGMDLNPEGCAQWFIKDLIGTDLQWPGAKEVWYGPLPWNSRPFGGKARASGDLGTWWPLTWEVRTALWITEEELWKPGSRDFDPWGTRRKGFVGNSEKTKRCGYPSGGTFAGRQGQDVQATFCENRILFYAVFSK